MAEINGEIPAYGPKAGGVSFLRPQAYRSAAERDFSRVAPAFVRSNEALSGCRNGPGAKLTLLAAYRSFETSKQYEAESA